jgi:hypothetical protein
MDWLEQELTRALARTDPEPGFEARVRGRMFHRPRWLAVAAAVLVVFGAGEAWRWHQGQIAKEQVMIAMRLTGSKLSRVQVQLRGIE